MEQAGLGHDDDFVSRRLFAKGNHFFRRTDFVGQHPHRIGAFRMRDHRRTGILRPNPVDAARRKLDVHVTVALP